MQYSIVQYSEVFSLESDSRLDSEFYKPNLIKSYRNLKSKPFTFLGSKDFYVTDGEHGSPDWDVNSGIKYITAENIEKNLIKETDFANISESQNTRNTRSILKDTDVLLYSVGAYCGNAAKMERHLLPANIPRSVAIIRAKSKIFNPSYISTFLNTEYGTFQTERLKAGNAQPMLALEQIKKIAIPNLLEDFQLKISDICDKSYYLRTEAKSLYQQAEDLLLEELGLKDWKPKHQLSYVKNYSDTQHAERFDAEYFQPQYDAIIERIKNYKNGFSSLGKEGKFTSGSFVSDSFYSESGTPYIRIKELSYKGSIDKEKMIFLDKKFKPKNETRVFESDFVIATIGNTIGKVNIIDKELSGAIPSNNTSKYELNNKDNSFFFHVLLQSPVVQKQIEREYTQTAQPKISDSSLSNIVIPSIDNHKKNLISEKMQNSFKNKGESKSLLEIAKKAVEIAIESNEEKATKWIDQELEKLGVRLSGN